MSIKIYAHFLAEQRCRTAGLMETGSHLFARCSRRRSKLTNLRLGGRKRSAVLIIRRDRDADRGGTHCTPPVSRRHGGGASPMPRGSPPVSGDFGRAVC